MESKEAKQDVRNEAKREEKQGDSQVITQSLPIPEYKMGWIIGKRGTYINQLSKKSGANITISDSRSKEYGTVWKYVQITGTGRAVDRAKKLLHIRLERLEPRDASAEREDAEVDADVGYSEGGPPEHLAKESQA